MSRKHLLAVAFVVVVLALVAFGGRLAGTIEHWLLALHGRH